MVMGMADHEETPQERQDRVEREYFSPEAEGRRYASELDEKMKTYGGVDLSRVMKILVEREMCR